MRLPTVVTGVPGNVRSFATDKSPKRGAALIVNQAFRGADCVHAPVPTAQVQCRQMQGFPEMRGSPGA